MAAGSGPAELWRSEERGRRLHSLQREIIIKDRLPGVSGYWTPEQFIPATPPAEPWEACMTIGESWAAAQRYELKDAREIIHRLAEIVSRGGDMLLNVSPMGNGALPACQLGASRSARQVENATRKCRRRRAGARTVAVRRHVDTLNHSRLLDPAVQTRRLRDITAIVPLKSVGAVTCLSNGEPLRVHRPLLSHRCCDRRSGGRDEDRNTPEDG